MSERADITAMLPGGWVAYDNTDIGETGDLRLVAYDGGVYSPRRGRVYAPTVEALVEAVKAQDAKVHDLACCAAATFRNFVCYVSFTCPQHGQRCYGSHD